MATSHTSYKGFIPSTFWGGEFQNVCSALDHCKKAAITGFLMLLIAIDLAKTSWGRIPPPPKLRNFLLKKFWPCL